MATAKPENEELQAVKSKAKKDPINHLIFTMLQQNPNLESGIQQATKSLTCLNEQLFRITKTIHEKQFEERQAYNRLYDLEYKEKGFRSMGTAKGKQMAALKRDLDKLTFANSAYKERSINTQGMIDSHNLCFRMHHEAGNMVKEKKLLKEVNAGQKGLNDSGPSVVEEISYRIWRLKWDIRRNYFIPRPAIRVDEEQLEWARDKAIANAPIKGKIWNSLPSKNVIKQQIKAMEEALNKDRKEHMQIRGEIEVVKREINGVKKSITSLKRQLLDVRRRKGKAYKVILKLIKTQNQPIC
ncbi:Nicotinamide N-methyltransferase-like protein [Gossypium australe]|uniref:Nicotinamide N-methyltransferase-like protein n=1 Tax=Gossypium australe TaxID=47621 RepID=A0A5B6WW05_9ROSI|nr:Nicotinamide N-methyltransferase-like protein [Gossypium australe]